jgi:hypothetical protein
VVGIEIGAELLAAAEYSLRLDSAAAVVAVAAKSAWPTAKQQH